MDIYQPISQPQFLPTSKDEMLALGWREVDILIVSGDAYIDHPAFAPALLGRYLLSRGFKVGIVPQPRWTEEGAEDIKALGRPRLFAGVTAGSMDSMLAHYTAFKKKRHDDAYTPGGKAGARPNRASIVYTNLLRSAFPGLPVVLGGIEASLRRISHYDFWTNAIRRSLLFDAKASLIAYGMAEESLVSIARVAQNLLEEREKQGEDHFTEDNFIKACKPLPGIVFADVEKNAPKELGTIWFPSHEEVVDDPRLLLTSTLEAERQVHQAKNAAVQPVGGRLLVITRPCPPLLEAQMDVLYSLPFARRAHPRYKEPIPAEDMLKTSVTTHRGCGGGCSFCSLAMHQGRTISSRSKTSVMGEVKRMLEYLPKGRRSRNGIALSDVGGPTANMWGGFCQFSSSSCTRESCLHPVICAGFRINQKAHVALLQDIRKLPGVSQVRVASGVRYDMALRDPEALAAYIGEFTGGQLKIAPEHSSDSVLELMRKPERGLFEQFLSEFRRACAAFGKEQYVVPYLMSAFPGCTDGDMRSLAAWLASKGWRPQQVQCFIPTPGTVATAMFHSGLDPSGKVIYVAKTDAERLRQHQILMGKDPFGLAKWTRARNSSA